MQICCTVKPLDFVQVLTLRLTRSNLHTNSDLTFIKPYEVPSVLFFLQLFYTKFLSLSRSFVIFPMSRMRWKMDNRKFLRFAVRCWLQNGVFAVFSKPSKTQKPPLKISLFCLNDAQTGDRAVCLWLLDL